MSRQDTADLEAGKIETHHKLGLVRFYLLRALEKSKELTYEHQRRLPRFVESVLPEIQYAFERDAAWFKERQDEIMHRLTKEEDPSYCAHCDRDMYEGDPEYLDNEMVCCSSKCVEARQAER